MGTRYINGVDTMKYTNKEITQFAESKPKQKTWVDLHDGELFGDGGVEENYRQCKDCIFRDKTIFNGEECGWYKSSCRIFEAPAYKPLEYSDGKAKCEFRETVETKE